MKNLSLLKQSIRLFCLVKDFKSMIFFMLCMCMTHPAWADLPKPPDKDIAVGDKDWGDVGGNIVYSVLRYACIILGVVILIGVAMTVIKAFYVAQEKQDLAHFFKTLIVGLIAASLGIGLVYAGYQIMPTSGG